MNRWIANDEPKNLKSNQIPKYRYLLFGTNMCYQNSGGMDDCIFQSNDFEEIENYCLTKNLEYIYVSCYDVVEDRIYDFNMI